MLRGSRGTRRSPRGVWGAEDHARLRIFLPRTPRAKANTLLPPSGDPAAGARKALHRRPRNDGAGIRTHHGGRGGRVASCLLHDPTVPTWSPASSVHPAPSPARVRPETTPFCFDAHLNWLLLSAVAAGRSVLSAFLQHGAMSVHPCGCVPGDWECPWDLARSCPPLPAAAPPDAPPHSRTAQTSSGAACWPRASRPGGKDAACSTSPPPSGGPLGTRGTDGPREAGFAVTRWSGIPGSWGGRDWLVWAIAWLSGAEATARGRAGAVPRPLVRVVVGGASPTGAELEGDSRAGHPRPSRVAPGLGDT